MRWLTFMIILAMSCTTVKDASFSSPDQESILAVLNAVISTYSQEESFCLFNESISFEYKFPEDQKFDLSTKEKEFIEDSFSKQSINWKDIIPTKVSSNAGKCFQISAPVFFRDGKEAFIYSKSVSLSNYDIYELEGHEWKLKENILSIIE